jgi:hypothetical protein
MELLSQLYIFAEQIPPAVSAIFSVVTWLVMYWLSKKILKGMDGQNTELAKIKVQTTLTNGSVGDLERRLTAHAGQDEISFSDMKTSFGEMKTEVLRNRNSIHSLRDQLSDFAIKVGLQARRINKRDDAIGLGSKSHLEEERRHDD